MVDGVVWCTDNKTLFFVTEDAVTKRSNEFHRHLLGTTVTDLLYAEPDELFDISVERSRDRAFIFLTSESKLSAEVRFLPAGPTAAVLRLIAPREPDQKYFA